MNLRKIVEATGILRQTMRVAGPIWRFRINSQAPVWTWARTRRNTCCGQPKDQCRSDPQAWDHPVWQALNFAVDGPHRYWYMFEPHGEGNESAFTARAVGNLDCDATYSTFEILGRVRPDGEVVIDPIRVKRPLE